MSRKSSCPTDCGPWGDVIPTLKPDEEQEDFSPKHLPHYTCFKSVNASDEKLEEHVENLSGGEPEKEVEDASCDIKPQKELPENASSDMSEKVDGQTEAAVEEDGNEKQKSKDIDHASLFNIADAKSDDVDYQNTKPFDTDPLEIPAPNQLIGNLPGGTPSIDMLVKGAKLRSQKSPDTKLSPSESPRELLQSVQLPPVASQEIYDDHAAT